MRRFALLLALPIALSGCGFSFTTGGPLSSGAAAPAAVTPLGNTAIDDRAVRLAWVGYDALLDTVDALVAAKVLVRGTPRALAVKRGVDDALLALEALSAAQRAANQTNYAAAMRDATDAMSRIRQAMRGSGQ